MKWVLSLLGQVAKGSHYCYSDFTNAGDSAVWFVLTSVPAS